MPRGVGTGAPARRREPTLRPPFAKMEDARLPCAAPSFPRAGHGTSARAFEDQRSAAALVARWSRSAPSTHSSLPRRGRERAQCPPCLL